MQRMNQDSIRTVPLEGRLLFAAARKQIDPLTRESMEALLKANPDWSVVSKLAEENKVLPLVYNTFSNHFLGTIPDGELGKFKEKVNQTVAWNEHTQSLLLDILRLFEKEKIPVAPFKGLVFTLLFYGSKKLRECGDIDILVRRVDFLRAKDLLIRNGYDHVYFGNHEAATVQAQFVRFDRSNSVDLHYGLTPHHLETDANEIASGSRLGREEWYGPDRRFTHWFFFLDTAPLWERMHTMSLDGMQVQVFSPEDQLLVAIINGVKEHWNKLSRVADLNELIRAQPELDWGYILGNARALRCEKKLYFGLRLTHEIYQTPLPARLVPVITQIPALSLLSRQMIQQFSGQSHFFPNPRNHRFIQVLFTTDCNRDRARYLRYVLGKLTVPGETRASLIEIIRFLRAVLNQLCMIVAMRLGLDLELRI